VIANIVENDKEEDFPLASDQNIAVYQDTIFVLNYVENSRLKF
jgi:hypothetical protein